MPLSRPSLGKAAVALGVGTLFAAIVFFGSGRAGGTVGAFHDSDFDAFDAAHEIFKRGDNPYGPGAVDAELMTGGERYSGDFVVYPGGQPRLFFNPPLWLSMLTTIGFSSNVLVVGGAFLTGVASTVLHRPGGVPIAVYPAVFFLWDRLFLWANAGFGQTGYLVSAAMLGSVVAVRAERPAFGGLSAALLSFKPHIWFAQLVGGSHAGRSVPMWQFLTSCLIGLASIGHLGWEIWQRYITSVLQASSDLPTNQSLTFTVIAPIFAQGPAVLLIGLAVVIGVIWLARNQNLSFEAKWILTVALLMMSSTHAFWHDWAWLIAVPILLRWRLLAAMAFYLLIPISSVALNSGPALVLLATLALILRAELRPSSISEAAPAVQSKESGRDRPTVLTDERV